MHNFKLLIELTKEDFYQRFIGSYLGVWWAFIQPIITICIFWFVFEVGFKVQPVESVPFILWLITGMLPWFFISEAISGGANSIISNTFLVKKIVFKVSLLPIIKIMSALVIHIVFIILLLLIYIYYGYYPNIYWLQLLYYIFASVVLVTGLSYITSSLVVFFKDLGVIIGILLQIGFWITPIFWNISMIPEKYVGLLKLNLAYYIVEGYRNALIHQSSLLNDIFYTMYFWVVTIIICILGIIIYKKLKPHFADLL